MNNFQDGAYTFWKAKWEQALASDANALDDLKIHVQEHTDKEHGLFSSNYATVRMELSSC